VPFPSSAARPRSTADFATRASFSLSMLAAAAAGLDTALLDGAADGELLDRVLLMRGVPMRFLRTLRSAELCFKHPFKPVVLAILNSACKSR
jgi:hypothetical protein